MIEPALPLPPTSLSGSRNPLPSGGAIGSIGPAGLADRGERKRIRSGAPTLQVSITRSITTKVMRALLQDGTQIDPRLGVGIEVAF
ncbi:hypothetical protein TgHK011_004896 [Trichoderma gracile]|nr:hypothetical protein TgHK011_004896 [Trichoderma gracile]